MSELLDAYLNGEATPEGEERLAEWLQADPENLRTFVRETALHGAMRDLVVARSVQAELAEEMEPLACPLPARRPVRRARLAWAAAAAVLLTVGALASILLIPSGPAPVAILPDPVLPPVVEDVSVSTPPPSPGTFNLRINVAPFADVVVLRADEVVARQFTPLGLLGLEVGEDYRVELSWPSREAPQHRVIRKLSDLRRGGTVEVSGHIARADSIEVSQ